ncbi:MAG TPA: hypothetical protein VIN09_05970 [Chloroflexota bacterium]
MWLWCCPTCGQWTKLARYLPQSPWIVDHFEGWWYPLRATRPWWSDQQRGAAVGR